MTRHQAEEPIILAVQVPGQRLGWLRRELDAAGIPYEAQRSGDGYQVRTLEAGQPAIDKVLNYKPQERTRRGNVVYDALRQMLPVCLLITAGAFFFAGIWQVAAAAIIFAPAAAMHDAHVERCYRHAEAVGYNMSRQRRGDIMFNLVLGGLLLLAAAFVLGWRP